MFVHFPTYVGTLRQALKPDRVTPQRAAYAGSLVVLHGAMYALGEAARAVDRVLYRDADQYVMEPPLFVAATPRSGTTYLYRLLALDEERFTHLKLHHTILPAISLHKATDGLARLNEALGGRLTRLTRRVDGMIFPPWENIHPIRLDGEEEDEAFFVFSLLSPGLYLLIPEIDQIRHAGFQDELPYEVRHRLAMDYRRFIRGHVYAAGGNRSALVKSALCGGRLGIWDMAFPDARFVHLVRHPYEAIPSAVSMFYSLWPSHTPVPKKSRETRVLAGMFIEWYRNLHEHAKKGTGRSLTIRYEDFVAEPLQTVERIYDAFGFQMSPQYMARLERQAGRERQFRSRHRYTLEDFGLEKREIYEALQDCFEEYGYDPEHASNGKTPVSAVPVSLRRSVAEDAQP